MFAAFLLQFVLGVARPATPPIGSGEKPSTARRVWNVVHAWNGRIAYIFALAQIYTGIHQLDRGNETLWEILFSALWGTVFLFAVFLQLLVVAKGSAFGDDGTATKVTWSGNTTDRVERTAAAPVGAGKGTDAAAASQPRTQAAEMTQTESTVGQTAPSVMTEIPPMQHVQQVQQVQQLQQVRLDVVDDGSVGAQ